MLKKNKDLILKENQYQKIHKLDNINKNIRQLKVKIHKGSTLEEGLNLYSVSIKN